MNFLSTDVAFRDGICPRLHVQVLRAFSPLVHPALFCINGNSYTISTQSDMYTFIHIYTVYTFFHNTGTLVGQKK